MFKYAIIISTIILLAFLIIVGLRNEKPLNDKINNLRSNGKLSVGIVKGKGLNNSGGIMQLNGVIYEFEVDENIHKATLGQSLAKKWSEKSRRIWATHHDNIEKGFKFLVLYDDKDPDKQSILCLDMPIKSEKDFERYKMEFKQKGKQKTK